MHGDGSKAVEGSQHIPVEGVPGDGVKLLWDRHLWAHADLLIVEPGQEKGQAEAQQCCALPELDVTNSSLPEPGMALRAALGTGTACSSQQGSIWEQPVGRTHCARSASPLLMGGWAAASSLGMDPWSLPQVIRNILHLCTQPHADSC